MRRLLAIVLLIISSGVAGEVRIASWNVQQLGWDNDKSFHAVARIASQYDFIAIQELMRAEAVEQLADELTEKTGERWETLSSEALGRSSYREQYAFLWRSDAVEYLDGAVVYLDPGDRFAREPFSARFRVRETGLVFAAATVHIVYGDGINDRTPEIRALADYWEWLEAIYPEERERLLLMGDFNLPPDHAAWAPMREQARPLITNGASTLSTEDRVFANLYDNILVPRDHNFDITEAGILAFPEQLTATDTRYWSHEAARNHVSDHAPVHVLIGPVTPHAIRTGHLDVPEWQEFVVEGQGSGAGPPCVDLNTASVTVLQRIPHIGAVRARAIVAGRPWGGIPELDRINGIGPARLADITASGIVCSVISAE